MVAGLKSLLQNTTGGGFCQTSQDKTLCENINLHSFPYLPLRRLICAAEKTQFSAKKFQFSAQNFQFSVEKIQFNIKNIQFTAKNNQNFWQKKLKLVPKKFKK